MFSVIWVTALGRKRTLILVIFGVSERPLWRKADILLRIPKRPQEQQHFGCLNVRFTPETGH